MVGLLPIYRQSSRLADQRCVISLQASKMWKHGSDWITREELRPTWSPTEIPIIQLAVAETDVLPPNPVDESSEVILSPTVATNIDIRRYSTLSKLLYGTAYVLRFIECLKSYEYGSKPTVPITVTKLSSVHMHWIASCQHSVYSRERD